MSVFVRVVVLKTQNAVVDVDFFPKVLRQAPYTIVAKRIKREI